MSLIIKSEYLKIHNNVKTIVLNTLMYPVTEEGVSADVWMSAVL